MSYLLVVLFSITIASARLTGETLQLNQEGVALTVTYAPTQCIVGDLINLQIHAVTDRTKQLSLDERTFGSFNVVDSHYVLDIPTAAGREWTWSLQLDTFDASVTDIEGITLNWSDPDNQTGSITITPLPIEIISVAGASLEEMSLRDIKPPLPLLRSNWWFVSFVLGLGLIVLFLASRFLQKKHEPMSTYAQAMLDLQSLREANLEALPFYTELSAIVRRYLEGRFDIKATGQTTREFLIASKNNAQLDESDQHALSTFLVSADLVKFARLEPTNDVCDKAITQAELFVAATVPSSDDSKVEAAA